MRAIATCLWFDGTAEAAAETYTELLPGSRIDARHLAPFDWPGGRAGDVILVEFTLVGQPFHALNGGPGPEFGEAMSLSGVCTDQAEVDRVWDGLLRGGGAPMQCGWLSDRFGVRWQVVPDAFLRMMRSDDGAARARVMGAMLGMVKPDVAALEAAHAG
jgi:predicted 3-demethylubiquinone-9 3-methyltransferase (glyoxalase superfamily)